MQYLQKLVMAGAFVAPLAFLIFAQTAMATGDVTIQIRPDSNNTQWSADYGGLGGISSTDGQGSKDIMLPGCDIYSANAQIKSDSGSLTMNAVEDGKIINTQTTNEQFGVVSVSGEC